MLLTETGSDDSRQRKRDRKLSASDEILFLPGSRDALFVLILQQTADVFRFKQTPDGRPPLKYENNDNYVKYLSI